MTQDEIIEMAIQAGFVVTHIGDPIGTNYAMIEAFAQLVAAKEREACANLCDEVDKESQSQWPRRFATMIRARGKA